MSTLEMDGFNCYRSPKVEVRASDLGGRGIFATATIYKDEVVAIKAGHIILQTKSERSRLQWGDYARPDSRRALFGVPRTPGMKWIG